MKEVHGSWPSPYDRCDNGEKENIDIMAMVFMCREVYTPAFMGCKQKRKANDKIIPPDRGQSEINHTGVKK